MHLRFVRAGIYSLCLLATGFSTRQARACSPPLTPVVELVSPTFPDDGLIVGVLNCGDCTVSDLTVMDESNTKVNGTFVAVRDGLPPETFAFQPTSTLSVDHSYTIQSADAGLAPVSFMVVSEAAQDPSLDAALIVFKAPASVATCKELDPAGYGSCGSPSYAAETDISAGISLARSGASSSQFAYSVSWEADDNVLATETFSVPATVIHQFAGEPIQVCASVTALPILGGTGTSLGKDCFATASKIPAFGVQSIPAGDLETFLKSCPIPPDDLLAQWCALYDEPVAAGSCDGVGTSACDNALLLCETSTTQTGGGSGTGGSESLGQGGGPGDVESSSSGSGDVSGCSVSGTLHGGGATYWVLMLVLLMPTWRRRRARSRE